MDSERAQEILNSPVKINVAYHGIPVFIEKVHDEKKTATVFPLDEMKNSQEVELEGLYEEGPY
ncbi:H-type small acid-soluble spore protein [Bacillus sp. FJAT-50079]|uniref:H-type small acid-soluble spore protein n=1 Tax=Bacillus sp. FJAT-50079 TaxID=2833577 RepID=UPI001BC95AA7|nr:H-type small acid-soluble spore protein [Bacillus sp. FJAT-50079]MBS4207027.1 H-type small acid-soluble spore protein [Bacillus sp. FJAT-50079]